MSGWVSEGGGGRGEGGTLKLTQLSAGYFCILYVPAIITNGAPCTIDEYLHTSIGQCSVIGGTCTIEEANRVVRCSEIY